VYDFDISPDGRQVVVSFGTVGCDYLGDTVYLVSFADGSSKSRVVMPSNNEEC
jgi:hypothetical protein